MKRSARSRPAGAPADSEQLAHAPALSLAARLQGWLVALYGVEVPHVDAFVVPSENGRETLQVVEFEGELHLRLYLPQQALAGGGALSLDLLCQVAEGVSHFVFLTERARRNLPATQLELELQGEVDKFLVAAEVIAAARKQRRLDPQTSSRLREKLFDRVTYLHGENTEPGERYRLANRLAARFVRGLSFEFEQGPASLVHRRLRRFFEAGQREKIELALAA